MQIQINTDGNVEGGEELSARLSSEVLNRLDRFSEHITRIEVHVSDENADKSGVSDKHCLIEARLKGRQPEVARDQAATVEGACSGAAKKLQSVLETTLGRLGHVKRTDTIRTGDL
jgi:ribosome-associated translation inhibitor RaiA